MDFIAQNKKRELFLMHKMRFPAVADSGGSEMLMMKSLLNVYAPQQKKKKTCLEQKPESKKQPGLCEMLINSTIGARHQSRCHIIHILMF